MLRLKPASLSGNWKDNIAANRRVVSYSKGGQVLGWLGFGGVDLGMTIGKHLRCEVSQDITLSLQSLVKSLNRKPFERTFSIRLLTSILSVSQEPDPKSIMKFFTRFITISALLGVVLGSPAASPALANEQSESIKT
jgi:hypothetical protein